MCKNVLEVKPNLDVPLDIVDEGVISSHPRLDFFNSSWHHTHQFSSGLGDNDVIFYPDTSSSSEFIDPKILSLSKLVINSYHSTKQNQTLFNMSYSGIAQNQC